MALLAKNIPNGCRETLERRRDAEQCLAGVDLRIAAAGLRDAGQIALDVGHKDRHAALAKALGQLLQRHGLTRSGRTGDHAVAIRHLRQKKKLGFCLGFATMGRNQ